MAIFYSPDGNPEIWDEKPDGYFTPEEWAALHPGPEPDPPTQLEQIQAVQARYQPQLDELHRAYTSAVMLNDEVEAADLMTEYNDILAAMKQEINNIIGGK